MSATESSFCIQACGELVALLQPYAACALSVVCVPLAHATGHGFVSGLGLSLLLAAVVEHLYYASCALHSKCLLLCVRLCAATSGLYISIALSSTVLPGQACLLASTGGLLLARSVRSINHYYHLWFMGCVPSCITSQSVL